MTFDGVAVAVGVAGELGIGGGSGGGDAGDAANSVESAGDDLRCAVFAVAGVRGIEAEGGETTDIEADGLVTEIVERANEEASCAEEENAECDLDADGEFAEALRGFGGGAGALAKGFGEVGPHEVQNRRKAEEKADEDGDGDGEEENSGVDCGRVGLAAGVGVGEEMDQGVSDDGSESQTCGCTGDAENAAFDEELGDDAGAAGSESVAHGHLAGAGGGAEEKKRGYVDGAHSDEQAGHAHEKDERGLEIEAFGGEAARVVFDLKMRVVEEAFGEAGGAIFIEGELLGAEGVPEAARDWPRPA